MVTVLGDMGPADQAKTWQIEFADLVAGHPRRALDTIPADKSIIHPDRGLRHLGLRHLPAEAVRARPCALVEGAVVVSTLRAPVGVDPGADSHSVESPPKEPLLAVPEPSVEQGV